MKQTTGESLAYWSLNKVADILQTTFSKALLWMKKNQNRNSSFAEVCSQGPVDNISALVQVMAWCWIDANPLMEVLNGFFFIKMHLMPSSAWSDFGLLHSLSRVAVGLSVGCETRPPIGWHYPFVIGSKYCMGLPHLQWIMNSHNWWQFPLFFRGHWQSSCTAPSAGNCLPLGLCKGTVKESRSDHGSLGLDMFILASAKLTSPAQGWGLLNRFHPFN